MTTKRALGLCLAGAVFAAALPLWWAYQEQRPDAFASTTPVRIAMSVTPLSTPFMIAQAKDYFAHQGLLNVSVNQYLGGHRALQAVLKGEADIATVSDLPIMFHSFERDDLAVLFTFVSSENDVKILSRDDVGIQEATDLRGKTIGVVLGSSSHFFARSFLTYHNIDHRDVNIVHVHPENMAKSLNEDKVDAIVIWEPFAFEAIHLLKNRIVLIKHPKEIYKETFNAVSLRRYADKNKEIIRRFSKSINNSISFIQNNKMESQHIVMKSFPKKERFIQTVWDDFTFELSLDQSFLLTLEREARWAIQDELIVAESIPNYLHYIYFDALKSIKPEAVNIIH